MVNEVAKKLRKQLVEAQEKCEREKKYREEAREQLIRANAKLERYEGLEAKTVDTVNFKVRNLEDQVLWLRELVEKLAIDPAKHKVFAEHERIMQKEEGKQRRHDEHMRNRMIAQGNKNLGSTQGANVRGSYASGGSGGSGGSKM